MDSIQEIFAPTDSRVWLTFQEVFYNKNGLHLDKPAPRKRRKSVAWTIRSNIKAARAAGLTINAIRPDGELILGNARDAEDNDWDDVLNKDNNDES
jgi:hypothetical protein